MVLFLQLGSLLLALTKACLSNYQGNSQPYEEIIHHNCPLIRSYQGLISRGVPFKTYPQILMISLYSNPTQLGRINPLVSVVLEVWTQHIFILAKPTLEKPRLPTLLRPFAHHGLHSPECSITGQIVGQIVSLIQVNQHSWCNQTMFGKYLQPTNYDVFHLQPATS